MFNFAAFEYYENKQRMRIERRKLRDTLDPFDIPDERFREMYRLPRSLALDFYNQLEMVMESELPDIPLYIQFCAALNFYGSGSYQRRVGSDAFASLSQTSISKIITSISINISEKLSGRYINFPTTTSEFETKREGFANMSNVPGVFALVDGTQINLAAVNHAIEHAYINRKGVLAINTQVICDSQMRFLNVNARYPGSTHDSFIWGTSLVHAFLEERYAMAIPSEWYYVILGDSGYPLQPWLMKPYDDPATDRERLFNVAHRKLRSLVERAIGLLKNRFRCLHKERQLHYNPRTAAHIIYACSVLHNFLIDSNFPIDDIQAEDDEDGDEEGIPEAADNNFLELGRRVRDLIAQYMEIN